MKSPNQFENLMNQYGAEAAAEQQRLERIEKKRRFVRSLRRVILLLMLLGTVAYGYMNRTELNQQLTKLKMSTTAELKSNREANAKAKVAEIDKVGQKRSKEVEEAISAKN
jgi:hypothetical protein